MKIEFESAVKFRNKPEIVRNYFRPNSDWRTKHIEHGLGGSPQNSVWVWSVLCMSVRCTTTCQTREWICSHTSENFAPESKFWLLRQRTLHDLCSELFDNLLEGPLAARPVLVGSTSPLRRTLSQSEILEHQWNARQSVVALVFTAILWCSRDCDTIRSLRFWKKKKHFLFIHFSISVLFSSYPCFHFSIFLFFFLFPFPFFLFLFLLFFFLFLFLSFSLFSLLSSLFVFFLFFFCSSFSFLLFSSPFFTFLLLSLQRVGESK